MKTLLQMTILVAGLAGLSACASSDASMGASSGSVAQQLAACEERVARLEEMNRSCYRK